MESSTEQPPTESHRSWWRLHLLTWVLVLLVGGSLVVVNEVRQNDYLKSMTKLFDPSYGWPEFYLVEHYGNKETIHRTLLFTNILIALLIVAATASTTESYLRRQAKWQFTIQGIILVTTFVALLLANAKYDFIRWRGDETWEFIPFFFIGLGLWCVFWTGWRLIGWGIGRIGGGSEDE